ncbi:GW dipeptide domain-containing protein [Actinobacillus equuli]|uniref:GW dipeptide domain-containing protein n=1 Tax=Actinobacillus equuli TaxID=718 RepID=UPI0024432970|nr:GW dipeptide domain-containing protein [Actinobacillus equuli]WGE86466.1 GW dipeptide domain-containing protein [Actinobacillus equuli subsp. haemolyticus]
MRFIVFLFLLILNSVSYANICDEGYSRINLKLNKHDIIWCKSEDSIQNNYFLLSSNKMDYKIEHSSFITNAENYLSSIDMDSDLFCSRDKISSISDDELLFFTKIPTGSNDNPYCYTLDLRYSNNKFHFVRNDSDVKVRTLNDRQVGIIKKDKQYLYKSPNIITKMYLVKGDRVTILKEDKDEKGDSWYFINYKGKKDINMWIKAEAIDLK